MPSPWVLNELKTADLKDSRLNDRLMEVLSQLAAHPTASIPAACGGHAEMTAAYRLFDNPKTTLPGILAPHRDATRQRVAQQPVVVLAQDTTEVDLTRPEQQVKGAGPLDAGARRGVFLHPLHAFTPDGTPLGTLHAQAWTRQEEQTNPRAAQSRAERAATPIEDKESYRWVEALRQGQDEAQHCPTTQLICVSDSESDIYELIVEGMAEPQRVDWIVRACQNRAVKKSDSEAGENAESTTAKHLREQVLAQRVLFTQSIHVRGRKAKVPCSKRARRQPRESRKALVEVRAARVTLRPPWRADRKLPEVTVNVVLAREVNPPAGDEPVEWLLLTSLPIETVEQVRQVIQYYCVRWMIEVFFRVLKSGCRIEERRFEDVNRILPCLAVYMIVAWRTLYTCRLGRSCPEMSCEAVFEPAEWKSVWKVIHQTTPPRAVPSMGEMIRLVAQLGGYVSKRCAPPGPQAIWIGLQRMHDFALCWQLFGPESRKAP